MQLVLGILLNLFVSILLTPFLFQLVFNVKVHLSMFHLHLTLFVFLLLFLHPVIFPILSLN